MKRTIWKGLNRAGLVAALSLAGALASPVVAQQPAQAVSEQEARAIAKDVYIYGFPRVENYRIIYAYFVDRNNPEYKAPFNEIKSVPHVYTPEDKTVQSPNSDTPTQWQAWTCAPSRSY